MQKITFSSAVLVAAMVAMPIFAQSTDERNSSSFTPITDLSSATAGWYQIKLATTIKGSSSEVNKYLSAANQEHNIGNKCYFLKYVSEPTEKKATTFIYVKGTTTSNMYNVQSINGHYLGEFGVAYLAGKNVSMTLNSDASSYTMKDKSNGRILDVYKESKAGEDSPLLGAYTQNNGTTSTYQLSAIDATQYDIYTVKFTRDTYSANVIGASLVMNNLQVSCNSAENLGLTSVYNDGKFFFPKGTEVTSDMFTVENDDPIPGYATQRSITIDSDKNIVVGYDKKAPSLNDGDVVKFTNVGTNYVERDLYMDAEGLKVNTSNANVGNKAYFIVKKLDGDKYAFVSVATGTYMKYAGKYNLTSTSATATTSGLAITYSDELCAVTLKKGTDSNVFNSYILCFGNRETPSNNRVGSIVINSSNGTFDGLDHTEFFKNGYSNLFRIQNVTDFTYQKVNLQSKDGRNYASIYLPFSYILPENVEAYYGKSVSDGNDQIVLTPIEGNVVPKATAVVLVSETVSGEQTLVPALNTTVPATYENKLSGTLESTDVESNKTYYAFTGKYDTIGFYKWTGTTLPLGKAYIALDSSSAASQAFALSFDKGSITGIDNAAVVSGNNSSNACYDLSGRKVSKLGKGVYVVNGKKVIF